MLRRRNPDDPALLSRVKLKITKSRSRVDVRAYDGAQMVGGAIFVRAPWTAQRHEKNVLESLSTEVLKPYQRKGLASLIYRTLTAQGFTIHPSSSQTWAGQQLWEGGRWPGKREVYQKRYPSTWEEKVAKLRGNPDDQDLLRRLVVETDDDPRAMRGKKGHYVEFRVYDGTMLVATANFLLNRAYADALEIQVADRYRRRGVASWIYRWVERKTGMRIRHSKDQTRDGKAFAAGRRHNPDTKIRVSAARGALSAEAGGCALEGRYGRPEAVVRSDDVHDTIPYALESRVLESKARLVAYVTKIVCYESSQGQGAGTRLMAAAIEKLRSMGVGSIFLNATPLENRAMMPALLRFYARLGFREVASAHDRSWVGMELVGRHGMVLAKGRRRNPGETKSIEDQMVKAYGVSPYADVMRAWILADGRILDLDRRDADGVVVANLEHDLMLPTYFERAGHPRYGYDQAMTVFMDLTGSIRLADGGGGAMFHLAKVPTPAQVTACGRIAAAHAAMDQDSIEIYYQPADRLVEVRPISAGKVRRILEALPGLPPAAAPRAKPRRNPPKDVETLKALGDECSVWAIAAATGRSVPEVRKAFLAVGADIWRKGGQGSGASMRQIRAVIRHLDFDHRIVAVGTSGMLGGGPRAQFAAMQSALFVRGRQREQIGADEFDVPEGLKDDVVRTMGPEAAVREVDGHVTVGSLIDQARSSGLSLLAVTMNARRYRGAYVVRAHVVGYSKAHGLYDTSVPTRAARAAFVQGKPDEDMTGIEWFGHGEDIPQRTRLAVLWVFFKPA